MYDVDGHKICRCVKQFTIIDSNSKLGAVIKPPGDPWSFNWKSYVWRSDGSAEVRNVKQNRVMDDIHPIEYEDGLASCLQAVVMQTKLVTLFRFTDNKYRWTKGLMKWYLRGDDFKGEPVQRYLVLKNQKNVEEKDENKQIQRIVWREGLLGYEDEIGTAATESQCKAALVRFVRVCGSEKQWEADDCGSIHDRIWKSLVMDYGNPVRKMG
ncbi:hypothetical protein FNYG_10804 [Fusarium nygamai]|uniref:Uncharacterized protein n=1 Tax=Gibberella nygamai TaxID=42673 RepID=A0A2K0W0Z0_GIBNY|nr:hypothetical protein FNYG_10804 [Fusarium nygamai]